MVHWLLMLPFALQPRSRDDLRTSRAKLQTRGRFRNLIATILIFIWVLTSVRAHASGKVHILQHLIDTAPRDSTGVATLVLRDNTAWEVDAPLRLPAHFRLVAPLNAKPIRANNDPGRTDRSRPVFVITGTEATPINDISVLGLRMQGVFVAAPIVIRDAANITIAGGEIIGSRGNAIAARRVRRLAITSMTMRFTRVPDSDPAFNAASPPEGGAGIWCFDCDDSQVDQNTLDATAFWQPGPSWNSGNAAVCVPGKSHPGCWLTRSDNKLARALDLVAFYGGARNRITGNFLRYGNTTGLYLNRSAEPSAEFPAQPTEFRITSNQVSNMREHGLDIVDAVRPILDDNRIADVGGAGIALAGTHDATVTYNRITGAASAYHPASSAKRTGGIILIQRTSKSRITKNVIDPGNAAYAIYVADDAEVGLVADNMMSPGKLGLTNMHDTQQVH